MKKLEKKISKLDACISRISCRPTPGGREYSYVVFSPSFRRFAVVNFLSPNSSIYDDFRIVSTYRAGIIEMSLEDIYDSFYAFACFFDFSDKHLTSSATFTSEELCAIDNKNISNLTFKFL